MRGVTSVPEDRNLKSYGIDIRLVDDIYNIPYKPDLFTKNILEAYWFEEQFALPFHSCVYSNESYKYNL